MFEGLENIDRKLFLALNDVHSLWLDTVMWYVSWTATWIPLFVFFLFYAYKKQACLTASRRQGIKFAGILLLGVAFCIALSDLISVYAFKEVFQRYRPTHNEEIKHLVKTVLNPDGEEYRGGLFGFVSSHAANFGAITFFLFLHFRKYSKWWYLLFLWLGLIAYSRIYLGVHYPSDLIAGGLLGLVIGYTVYRLTLFFFMKSKSFEIDEK